MQWKPHSCILTCPEHKFKGRNREPIRDFATFAYQHTFESLKLEITETCISSKKRKKMLGPYGEIALRKIKSKESIKKVIHIVGLAFSLVCIQRDWNQAE